MYCVKCGKELEGNDQYCKDCSPKNASSDDLVFGIIALVMGIMSFLGGGIITSIVAIWLGDKSINTKGEVYGKPGKTLGIVSLVLCCFIPWVPLILGLVGLILGGVAIAKKMPGKGMAIAGLVCSIITVVLYVITMIAGASAMAYLESLF